MVSAVVGALTGALRGVVRALVAALGRRGKVEPDDGSGRPRPGPIADEARWSAPPGQVTRVVDAARRGDHATIGEAIAAAAAGDRIVVRPGTYREGLILDK